MSTGGREAATTLAPRDPASRTPARAVVPGGSRKEEAYSVGDGTNHRDPGRSLGGREAAGADRGGSAAGARGGRGRRLVGTGRAIRPADRAPALPRTRGAARRFLAGAVAGPRARTRRDQRVARGAPQHRGRLARRGNPGRRRRSLLVARRGSRAPVPLVRRLGLGMVAVRTRARSRRWPRRVEELRAAAALLRGGITSRLEAFATFQAPVGESVERPEWMSRWLFGARGGFDLTKPRREHVTRVEGGCRGSVRRPRSRTGDFGSGPSSGDRAGRARAAPSRQWMDGNRKSCFSDA